MVLKQRRTILNDAHEPAQHALKRYTLERIIKVVLRWIEARDVEVQGGRRTAHSQSICDLGLQRFLEKRELTTVIGNKATSATLAEWDLGDQELEGKIQLKGITASDPEARRLSCHCADS